MLRVLRRVVGFTGEEMETEKGGSTDEDDEEDEDEEEKEEEEVAGEEKEVSRDEDNKDSEEEKNDGEGTLCFRFRLDAPLARDSISSPSSVMMQ
jgi:hypothetical protein